jgi:mycothiol synthase
MNSEDTGYVELKDAPLIQGLGFRYFRGDEDYPAILAVNSGSKIADGMGHDLHTLESITHTYNSSHNHDPRRDMIIAEIDGNAVGYSRVFYEHELEGADLYWHFGFMLPEWRGQGIGKAMIHWAEMHARELDRERGGTGTIYASTQVDAGEVGLENLLRDIGYEPVRYQFYMETPNLDDIPDVPMPEGLEIRPAKPEHYRAIWEASVEAFRDHWGATETGEEDFDNLMNHPHTQPDLWVVAWEGDQVAGSIMNFIRQDYNEQVGRKLGYTENISVRRAWRRQGLARAMLAHSMKMHRDLGMLQTALGVDTQNPTGALQLYESMGYEVVAKSTAYRKRL